MRSRHTTSTRPSAYWRRNFERSAIASLFQHDSDRETHLVFLRVIMEVESFTSATTVLATRGDRLALTRLMFRGEITFGGDS